MSFKTETPSICLEWGEKNVSVRFGTESDLNRNSKQLKKNFSYGKRKKQQNAISKHGGDSKEMTHIFNGAQHAFECNYIFLCAEEHI